MPGSSSTALAVGPSRHHTAGGLGVSQLIELARLVDEGRLRPQVGAVYPLAQAAEAYSAKAGGGIPGRIVLRP